MADKRKTQNRSGAADVGISAPQNYNRAQSGGRPYSAPRVSHKDYPNSQRRPAQSPAEGYGGRNQSPMTYDRWRSAKPAPARRTGTADNTAAARRVSSYSTGEVRQMHIPIPPSESGRYPSHQNPYYDRTPSGRATGQRAQDIQKRLKGNTQSPPQNNAQRTANPAGRTSAQPKKNAPKRETAGKREWAMPENSALYSAYGAAGKRNGQRPEPRRNEAKARENAAQRKALAEKRAEQKREKREKRRFYIKAFFVRLGIVFLVCCLIVGGLYYFNFSADGEKSGSVDYSVRIGEKHNFSADGSNAYVNGIMYIDFSDLARVLGIASVGSIDAMRFIVPDSNAGDSSGTGNEEYVIFSDGMRSACVNGTGIIMEGACRTEGLDVWVPFSFVENYVRGIVSEKDGSLVIITAENEETDKDGNVIPPEISFSLSKPFSLPHVEYPS